MTKYTFLLIGLLQMTLCVAQSSFEKIINTSSDEKGNSVKVLADANYIVAFSSNAFGAGNSDIGIMKTTPNGTVIWTKFYGGNAEDVPSMVLETATGDLLILGMTYSFGAGDRDIYLLKTDNMGNLLWSKTYGSAATDRGFVIIPTLDGGYAIAGSNQLNSGSSYDAYVLKIDSNGNLQWTHSIGGGLNDTCMDIRQNPDGTYMLAISFSSYGAGFYDISVCKLAENGDFIWATITGMTSSDNILTITPIVGGDYLIAGHTKSWGIGGWDIFAMRIDSIGNVVWAKTYGGTSDDYAEIITNTTQHECHLLGFYAAFIRSFGI
jgi:hypothetical protein